MDFTGLETDALLAVKVLCEARETRKQTIVAAKIPVGAGSKLGLD